MRLFLALFLVSILWDCYALNCRSEGGPREEEMKTVYMNCLKKQDGRHNETRSNNQGSRRRHERWRDQGERAGGRDDSMDDDYGDMPKYNYRSSTQPSRRYKRERQRKEKNSGHRSQYNPNASNKPYENENRDERNSSENGTRSDRNKDCALHCFLEELNMTDDNGVPDRYMVSLAITKDVRNEDLKDFLQESIEECFQILYNDNNQDKCEFSKNLLMCLSEKGRANCDDWKDDLRF